MDYLSMLPTPQLSPEDDDRMNQIFQRLRTFCQEHKVTINGEMPSRKLIPAYLTAVDNVFLFQKEEINNQLQSLQPSDLLSKRVKLNNEQVQWHNDYAFFKDYYTDKQEHHVQ